MIENSHNKSDKLNSGNKKQKIDMELEYKNLIVKWIEDKYNRFSSSSYDSAKCEKFYQQCFKKRVIEVTRLNILFDKKAYSAITKMLKQIQNFRILDSQNRANYKNRLYKLQNADKIVSIAQQLTHRNYITKSMLKDILKISSSQYSLQSILNKIILQASQQSTFDIKLAKQQQIWEKYFGDYSFEEIWKLMLKNSQCVGKQKIQKICKIFSKLIDSHKNSYLVLYIKSEFNEKQVDLTLLLKCLAKNQNLQEYGKNNFTLNQKILQNELSILYERIADSIKIKNINVVPKFQLFGSFRSGFHTCDSDFDITVFCRHSDQQQINANILETIEDHFETLGQNYVISIRNISQARVPVLKMELRNEIVRSVDIVLNNAHGVQNSRFLQNYSAQPQIRQFGILVKTWAKFYNLNAPKKFSSYSLIYMMLYYLIKHNKLLPAKRSFIIPKKTTSPQPKRGNRVMVIQKFKSKIHANAQLQKNIDLYSDFVGFLNFYSQDGQFLQREEPICLLEQSKIKQQQEILRYDQTEGGRQNCIHAHRLILKWNYLINIHDPFDDSNPGRTTKDNKQQFFDAIQDTLQILKKKDIKAIMNIFKHK